jgi:hypothetical protein
MFNSCGEALEENRRLLAILPGQTRELLALLRIHKKCKINISLTVNHSDLLTFE